VKSGRNSGTESPPRSRRTHRARESTLLDFGDRPSLADDASTEKNRFLLTILTGPSKGSIFKLEGEVVTLGRSDEADIALPDPSLSRVHCRFLRVGRGPATGYLVEDFDSTNGTYVGGERIDKPTFLTDGVRVGLGKRTIARYALQDELEEQAIVSVHESALRDALTGAYNRRVFDDRLQGELAFSVRHKQPLSLLLLDVDHFKQFNDTHGHQAGDRVLQVVSRRIAETLRTEDVFARYGGEEFGILVRDTTPVGALVVAERLRGLVADTPIVYEGRELSVTVSIGVACNGADSVTAEQLIKEADEALYRAKERGRDRVVVFDA